MSPKPNHNPNSIRNLIICR